MPYPPTASTSRIDLHSLFGHFWENPRSASPPPSESFGWWRGKVAGDSRSFAQVAPPSPPRTPTMADKGGARFHGGQRGGEGRGNNNNGHSRAGFADRGHGSQRGHNMVWTRDSPEGSGNSQFHGDSGTLPPRPGDRWEAATTARASKVAGNQIPDPSRPNAGGNSNSSSTSAGIQGNASNPGMNKEATV